MSIDYKALASSVKALVRDAGVPFKVTRGAQRTAITSGYGVFTKSEQNDLKGSSLPGVSAVTTSNKTLITEALPKAPQVGDFVECKQGTFRIATVEGKSPAATVVVYKLGLQ